MNDDLISRAAAIDALKNSRFPGAPYVDTGVSIAIGLICDLPPATQYNTSNTLNALDTISRQAAIDAVESVDWYHQNKNGEMVHGANDDVHQAWYKAEDIYKAIKSVPSAQPVEDVRAMCGECDAWNKYKNYPQPEQFNPCTVCQEFDCSGCKFRRT